MTNVPDARYEMYDCIEVNLAAFAERAHGAGAGLALGAVLAFQPRHRGAGKVPTVEQEPDHEIAAAAPALGLRIETVREPISTADVAELATSLRLGSAPVAPGVTICS